MIESFCTRVEYMWRKLPFTILIKFYELIFINVYRGLYT